MRRGVWRLHLRHRSSGSCCTPRPGFRRFQGCFRGAGGCWHHLPDNPRFIHAVGRRGGCTVATHLRMVAVQCRSAHSTTIGLSPTQTIFGPPKPYLHHGPCSRWPSPKRRRSAKEFHISCASTTERPPLPRTASSSSPDPAKTAIVTQLNTLAVTRSPMSCIEPM